MAWLSSHVLARLRVPTWAPERGSEWSLLNRALLLQLMHMVWTNHSERATLMSILTMAGIERKRRDARY